MEVTVSDAPKGRTDALLAVLRMHCCIVGALDVPSFAVADASTAAATFLHFWFTLALSIGDWSLSGSRERAAGIRELTRCTW